MPNVWLFFVVRQSLNLECLTTSPPDSLHATRGSQVQVYLCLQFSLVRLQMIRLDYYDRLFGRCVFQDKFITLMSYAL
jgi:hypothetical protein